MSIIVAQRAPLVMGELTIEICRDHYVEFKGTAAQLEAEGLIPAGFEWPKAATRQAWEAGELDFWLGRRRPEGHKGPARSWHTLDNWFLQVRCVSRDWHWHSRRAIERIADELRAEIHRQSPEGRHQFNEKWARYTAARHDSAFQAFRARVIPERRKPGRPRRVDRVNAAEGAA